MSPQEFTKYTTNKTFDSIPTLGLLSPLSTHNDPIAVEALVDSFTASQVFFSPEMIVDYVMHELHLDYTFAITGEPDNG